MPRYHDRFNRWLIPLLLAGLALLFARLTIFEQFELRLLDLRFKLRSPRPLVHTPFQIVAIDDQSQKVLGMKWPFPRSYYVPLIDHLNRAGARAIVFDVEFTEPDLEHPEEDTLFARAVEQAGNVILAGKAAYHFSDKLSAPYSVALPPISTLLATGAPWGYSNALPDPDDFIRRYLLYLPIDQQMQHLLGMEILRILNGWPASTKLNISHRTAHFGAYVIPLYDRQSFLINYYGPTGTFPHISFSSVLDDSTYYLLGGADSDYMERFYQRPTVSPTQPVPNPFKDRIILVGAALDELPDNKNTPFFDYEKTPRKMPGVEVHAHALQTILDRSFILRIPTGWLYLLLVMLASFIFQVVVWFKSWKGILLTVLAMLLVVFSSFWVFAHWNYWLDLTAFLLVAILAYLSTALYHYYLERHEKTQIRNMFAHYLPAPVVAQLLAQPERIRLGGERRVLSILFADINGFTSLSERMPTEQLVELLNEYLTAMTEVIHAQGGIIDKYEGDLIMAEFGVPLSYPDHAIRACTAALQMQGRLRQLRQYWKEKGTPPLSVRIGINTGEVIVGNMGSREVFDYTVVGDAVNLCARLEEANKVYSTEIIISQETANALPPTCVTRPLEHIRVRGRTGSVRVLELMAERTESLTELQVSAWQEYLQGWSSYQNRDWAKAIEHFQAVCAAQPDDKPAQILLERCRSFLDHPPDSTWDGVYSLTDL